LQGSSSEWSLARRWEGERQFGVQLCGSKPALLVPAAEALQAEIGGGLDFVDVSDGLPQRQTQADVLLRSTAAALLI
jgi:tRNA-dihydrouridine synthase 3